MLGIEKEIWVCFPDPVSYITDGTVPVAPLLTLCIERRVLGNMTVRQGVTVSWLCDWAGCSCNATVKGALQCGSTTCISLIWDPSVPSQYDWNTLKDTPTQTNKHDRRGHPTHSVSILGGVIGDSPYNFEISPIHFRQRGFTKKKKYQVPVFLTIPPWFSKPPVEWTCWMKLMNDRLT